MRDAFQKQFGPAGDIRIFRAPGRVNLIGEHTD
jgi:galactokinase